MEKIFYNKLIRDRIPEIIEAAGKQFEIMVMEEEEYLGALRKKVIEEAEEVNSAPESDLIKEIADLLEVINSLMLAYAIDPDDVEKVRCHRYEHRGGFEKRLKLIWSERKSSTK